MEISLKEFKPQSDMSSWIYISFPNPAKPTGSNKIGFFITNRKSTEEKLSWKERKVLKKLKAKIRDKEIKDFNAQYLSRKFKSLYYETYRSNSNFKRKKYNSKDKGSSTKTHKAMHKNSQRKSPPKKYPPKEQK